MVKNLDGAGQVWVGTGVLTGIKAGSNPLPNGSSPPDWRDRSFVSVGSWPSMEKIVRPFVTVDSAPRPTPVKRDPLPGEDTEAYIEWGARSNFIITQLTDPIEQTEPFGGMNFRLQPDSDKDKPSKKELVLTEYQRTTDKVKVTNPENESNWVMVERITEITFQRSDGGSVRMKFNGWK